VLRYQICAFLPTLAPVHSLGQVTVWYRTGRRTHLQRCEQHAQGAQPQRAPGDDLRPWSSCLLL